MHEEEEERRALLSFLHKLTCTGSVDLFQLLIYCMPRSGTSKMRTESEVRGKSKNAGNALEAWEDATMCKEDRRRRRRRRVFSDRVGVS